MSSNISPVSGTLVKAESSQTRLGYLPALDGLRALAVLAVLFYHADVLWLPGGFLGVEVFFVVSGFLITSLLLSEYRANNSINLFKFWQRRARRLLPALFAVLLAVSVYAILFLPDEVAALRADVLASLTYITNWYLITAEQSYFQVMGRPSLLRHLWSLAVEEQFYLLWPLIFAFLLVRFKARTAMLLLMLAATASALWMGALFVPDTDPSRIYYGTDTRAAGLLIGAALAFVIQRKSEKPVSTARRWGLDLIGFVALGALVVGVLWMSEFDPFLYQGGMLLVSAFTALLIAAAVSPNSPVLGAILGIGILRWIGLRSYALYLWHWPVYMVTRPQLDTTLEGVPLLALRLAITFALAEISYRIIERPIRNGALGNAWNSWNHTQGARRFVVGAAGSAAIGVTVAGLIFLASMLANAQLPPEPNLILMTAEDESVSGSQALDLVPLPLPEADSAAEPLAVTEPTPDELASENLSAVSFILPGAVVQELTDGQQSPAAQESAGKANPSSLGTEGDSARSEVNELRRLRIENAAKAKRVATCTEKCEARRELLQMKEGTIRPATLDGQAALQQPKVEPPKIVAPPAAAVVPITRPEDAQVFAIGDSVMLGASNYLRHNVQAIDVDAKLGRQVSAALQILRDRANANLLTPVVVVHMGNNGTFSPRQFDEMMTVLKDVPRVVFLTNKVPRNWQGPNNSALVEGVQRYPNAMLVDWNNISMTHPEWFWADGIHLRPEGAQVYTALIAQALHQPVQ